jgi:uncharacterized protein
MNSYFTVKTNSGNNYFISCGNHKQVHVAHPVFCELVSIKDIILSTKNAEQLFDKKHEAYKSLSRYNKKDVIYYFKKFKYFEDLGYFNSINLKDRFATTIDPMQIELYIKEVNHIVFETTDLCNMDCSYCGQGNLYFAQKKRTGKNMNPDLALNFLKYYLSLIGSNSRTDKKQEIRIGFYGGEPLLNYKFIYTIVSFLKKSDHGLILKFGMTTNAILLKKYISFLSENNFDLFVSLDGGKTSNSYRKNLAGKETFDQIFNDLKWIQQNYTEYFEKRINFNAVMHNKNSVKGLYEFFKKEFDKYPTISPLNENNIRPSKRNEFYAMYGNVLESYNEALKCSQNSTYSEDLELSNPEYRNVLSQIQRMRGGMIRDPIM